MMITTHDLKKTVKVDPQKLNQITTSIIPEVKEPEGGWPTPVGDGFAKLITTNDEPKAAAVPAPAVETPEYKKGDGKKKA